MSERMRSALTIQLLGPFDVQLNGAPLPRLRTRKGQWLLALLALRHGCSPTSGPAAVERAWLAGVLWPESSEAQALASLRNCLTDLRHALGREAGRIGAPSVHTLSLELTGAEVDVLSFDAAVARTDACSLETAVALYRGPLLEGCAEEWVLPERQAREEAYLTALETLGAQASARGDAQAAVRHLRRVVAVEPSRETAQRALMQALADSRSYGAATQVYRDLCLYLHRELNAEPDAETKANFERLRAEARGLAQSRPTTNDQRPTTTTSPPHHLTRSPPAGGELEPVGGAVPLGSPYYVARRADQDFHEALARRDSIVLVKGARQMGKTSLLGRGLQQARQAGARVALTDLQLLSGAHLASAEAFYVAVGSALADQLELDVFPDQVWAGYLGPSMNFNRYLRREVLSKLSAPLVWGLDQVDVLATRDFGTEVFSLLRSWHDQRVTDADGPWSRLTLVIAYATEAHLFIADVNQSPFNVGTRVTLDDFTLEEVADLNRRYGSPLRDTADVERFYRLVGGHPDLVRRGLQVMSAEGIDIAAIEAETEHDAGIFGDHLRRLLGVLTRDPELKEAAREVLSGRPCPTAESFYRLRSAGMITGASARSAQPRCRLFAAYLERHLM